MIGKKWLIPYLLLRCILVRKSISLLVSCSRENKKNIFLSVHDISSWVFEISVLYQSSTHIDVAFSGLAWSRLLWSGVICFRWYTPKHFNREEAHLDGSVNGMDYFLRMTRVLDIDCLTFNTPHCFEIWPRFFLKWKGKRILIRVGR